MNLLSTLKQFPKKGILHFIRQYSSTADDVIFQNVGNAGLIIFNRPKVLNALTYSMVMRIYDTLKIWEHEKSLIVVKGAGEKAFCVGGDLKLVALPREDMNRLREALTKQEYRVNALIKDLKIPYVALIDGMIMGGGMGMSVHGSYRIATERAMFAMPEALIGLVPDVGSSYVLPRMPGKLGLFLALTGFRLKGGDLLETGIATHYTDSQNLNTLEKNLLKCNSREQIEDVLQTYSKNVEDFSLVPYLDTINYCFGASTLEEIIERLQKDGSEWTNSILQLLNKMSPTSLKVCFKQMEMGPKMTLKECLQMEYRILYHCYAKKDFYEGVRVRVIDKGQKPVWDPPKISQVTSAVVDSYFAKLPEHEELHF